MTPPDRTAEQIAADLEAFADFSRLWRESPSEWHDATADAFYRDTGMMAPGKSQPMEMGGDDYAARSLAWVQWLTAKRKTHEADCLRAAALLRAGAERREPNLRLIAELEAEVARLETMLEQANEDPSRAAPRTAPHEREAAGAEEPK